MKQLPENCKISWLAKPLYSSSEKDDWAKGVIDTTREEHWCEGMPEFIAPTFDNLVRQIFEFYRCPRDHVCLDVCDEPGRLEVSKLALQRNTLGITPSQASYKTWEAGDKEMYYTTYTYQVCVMLSEFSLEDYYGSEA